jgi:eukaryotic-like serine/threonine-protein kinase
MCDEKCGSVGFADRYDHAIKFLFRNGPPTTCVETCGTAIGRGFHSLESVVSYTVSNRSVVRSESLMPAPTTADVLFDHLRKSGIIPLDRLDDVVGTTGPSASVKSILTRLVSEGLLTPFQADRVQVGKYKGFVLGGYIILDRLGGGGMGQVYLAEHSAMRRHVALKVLPYASAADQVARERFLREARAAATLNHPNIIKVHDLRRDGYLFYLVMEFVEGNSLAHHIARGGPLSPYAAADYARQVAYGLQHAHEHGLVHRDIKPANLLLCRDGTVKVLDLGLVRSEADAESKLTEKVGKAILGTADYLAPEQAVDSSKVDIRADIYSLGATLYYLLAGRPMFPDGRTAQKLMYQQLKEPTPIRDLRPDVPEGLAAVLDRTIRKKADERFEEPKFLADALAEWADLNSETPDVLLMPPPPPRWLAAGRSVVSRVPVKVGGESSGDLSPIDGTPSGSRPRLSRGSSQLIQLPPYSALSPTMPERHTITPQVLVPPSSRTPLPVPLEKASGIIPTHAPPLPSRRRTLAVGASLVVLGAVACLTAVWLAGLFSK